MEWRRGGVIQSEDAMLDSQRECGRLTREGRHGAWIGWPLQKDAGESKAWGGKVGANDETEMDKLGAGDGGPCRSRRRRMRGKTCAIVT
jgi:hypothetical protein